MLLAEFLARFLLFRATTTAVAQLVTSLQPITRDLRGVSFLLACNFLLFQPRNFNDGNTLDSRAATFRDSRQDENSVPTRRFTRTIVHNNTSVMLLETKSQGQTAGSYLVRNRRKGNQAAQAESQHTRENTQETRRKSSRASRSPTQTRERPTPTKVLLVP